jgi:hypothetical protein
MKGPRFHNANDTIKNATEEQKTFTKWLPEKFQTLAQYGRSV